MIDESNYYEDLSASLWVPCWYVAISFHGDYIWEPTTSDFSCLVNLRPPLYIIQKFTYKIIGVSPMILQSHWRRILLSLISFIMRFICSIPSLLLFQHHRFFTFFYYSRQYSSARREKGSSMSNPYSFIVNHLAVRPEYRGWFTGKINIASLVI